MAKRISAKPRRRGKRIGSRPHGPSARARRGKRVGRRHKFFKGLGGAGEKSVSLKSIALWVGVGGASGVGAGVLSNLIADKQPLDQLKTGAGKTALHVGVAVGVAFLAHKFAPKKFALPIIAGSLVGAGIDVFQNVVMPHLSQHVGLSGFETLEQNLGMIEAVQPGSLNGLLAMDTGMGSLISGSGIPGISY